MIQKIVEQEITGTSHPFATAYKKCRFDENGYVEEEFFIHGTSNIYEWQDGRRGRLPVCKPCTGKKT